MRQAYLLLVCLITCMVIVNVSFTGEVTQSLEAAGNVTTWSTTTYRMMDVANNLYASDYQDRFDYYIEPERSIQLSIKDPSTWQPVPGAASGTLIYSPTGPTFEYEFDASGLNIVEYLLIYYPDPWPGNGLIVLGSGTPTTIGDLHLEGSVDTGDLPAAGDPNPGAKIWLVPSNYVNQTACCMTGWNVSQFLLEVELVTYEKKYHPNVTVTYHDVGTTFCGSMSAVGLKPNFSYQVKLVGKPENDPQWVTGGDDWSNQSIGYAGRWFEQAPGSGNRVDAYITPRLSDPTYIFEGYLLFDFFTTDDNGNADLEFNLNSSYHVLWKESQRSPGSNDSDTKWHTFSTSSSSIAYDMTGGPYTEGIYAEWQNDRPTPGNTLLPLGQYNVQLLLTEESFHSSGLGGYWAGAMVNKNVEFTIVGESLMLYKKHPSTWQPIQTSEIAGEMIFNSTGPEFSYIFDGIGLNPAKNYSLIYYPDPWPGWNLLVLGSGTPETDGTLHIENSLETGDLPFDGLGYYSWGYGAKIWLVLTSDVSSNSPKRVIGWHQSQFLFENNLITYEVTERTGMSDSEAADKIFSDSVPDKNMLMHAYPNPFNPTTTISYLLAENSHVNLSVYDVSGRMVAELVSGWRDAGLHGVTFDATYLASGIYLYCIQAEDFSFVQKMILVK